MSEIDLIRRLVEKLAEIERAGVVIHKPWKAGVIAFDGPADDCTCILCEARQYLEWRDEPKVEDPASDQIDLEEAIRNAEAKVMP